MLSLKHTQKKVRILLVGIQYHNKKKQTRIYFDNAGDNMALTLYNKTLP